VTLRIQAEAVLPAGKEDAGAAGMKKSTK
jgi:hypothetical protein